MKIHRVKSGIVIEAEDQFYLLTNEDWDGFINRDEIYSQLSSQVQQLQPITDGRELLENELLPPIGSQEIWGAGVTYYRSRDARMEEAKDAGGGDFYQKVYHAERPEIFFKATPHRAAGHGQGIRIRKDSHWDVPEPELALCITSSGKIIGYTIGNDVSSRSIEGENPLYLPQAKTYDKSVAIGPCITLQEQFDYQEAEIALMISRGGERCFAGKERLTQMKRSPEELVAFLYRECSFPVGCLLLTGTGIVPDDDFTLQAGDRVDISIDGIGTLSNYVE